MEVDTCKMGNGKCNRGREVSAAMAVRGPSLLVLKPFQRGEVKMQKKWEMGHAKGGPAEVSSGRIRRREVRNAKNGKWEMQWPLRSFQKGGKWEILLGRT